MFENLKLIARFNQIVLTLRLLGYNDFNNSVKAFIWKVISGFSDSNEKIVAWILDGSYKEMHPVI